MKNHTKSHLKQKNKPVGKSVQLRTNLRAGTTYDRVEKGQDPDAFFGVLFDNE